MLKRLLSVVALVVVLAPVAAHAQDEVVYYHTDAIGSVRMVTDATGAVIARYDYLPFGETWPTSPPNTAPDVRQFAGKERDVQTDLDYFGAGTIARNRGDLLRSIPHLILKERFLSRSCGIAIRT